MKPESSAEFVVAVVDNPGKIRDAVQNIVMADAWRNLDTVAAVRASTVDAVYQVAQVDVDMTNEEVKIVKDVGLQLVCKIWNKWIIIENYDQINIENYTPRDVI